MQINEIYRDIVVVLCLNYSKDIKGLKYIIVTLLTLFWIFYATPAILLRIPYVQQKVATTATRELSERLGVPVRIGNVDIEWFNRLVLENLNRTVRCQPCVGRFRNPAFAKRQDRVLDSPPVRFLRQLA